MTDSTITIEVNGQTLEAKPGQMLIEVTDAAGINIPRFCYHEKLSIAANCRMCLIEVEKAPKPLPACATPVADGMKVHTQSPVALAAQKGTMEFLLINHPLDCPICDQGGECELQDVALGYGNDVSRYVEGKRVVSDPDIGPLVATDMTRCIHCTRCVRFGAEIAGVREMGATGRGEHMKIGTYVQRAVESELSGNIIDVCPVGALTSKPFRFRARAWELVQREAVAMHDGVGSNLFLHVRRGEVLRAVPRANESVNECWISDRDRFSYEGLNAADRALKPMLREGDKLCEVEWEQALNKAAEVLRVAGNTLATLISPTATNEEMYLAQKLTRGLGSNNIDHRLRQTDFRQADADPALPWLGQPIAEIENDQAILLVGSNIRKDQPILGHRVRKAARNGCQVSAINPIEYDFHFALAQSIVARPSALLGELAAVAKAAGVAASSNVASVLDAAHPGVAHKAIAEQLKGADKGLILLGAYAVNHPDFSLIRELADALAKATGVAYGVAPEAANTTGAWQVGAVPHRLAGGAKAEQGGADAGAMLAEKQGAYLLLNVEPAFDVANPAAAQQVLRQSPVVALTSYASESLLDVADVVLPIGSFAETAGSATNLQGDVQRFNGAVAPVGEARPGWKVLRVLGNLCNQQGFEQNDCDEVHAEMAEAIGTREPSNELGASVGVSPQVQAADVERVADVAMYGVDAVVRRAHSLQLTGDAWKNGVRLNATTADRLGVAEGDAVRLDEAVLTVEIDKRVADGCVWLPVATTGAQLLDSSVVAVKLTKG